MSPTSSSKLFLLNTIFITVVVVSNFLSSKMAQVCGLVIPAGTIGYAITFLVTDIVGELYGREESARIVRQGFWAIILAFLLSRLAIWLPSFSSDPSYSRIFGMAGRVMIGSICGYLASQVLDIIIFHKIKQVTEGRMKWLRNNVGTIISQAVDTVIFTIVAFWGIVPDIWSAIVDLIIAKAVLAILDTPFFYLFTRNND